MSRSLTQAGFARRVGWTQQYIQKCEAGAKNPIKEIDQIAAALDFPAEFFLLSDVEPVDPDGISFRKRKSATLSLRSRIAGLASIAASNLSEAIRDYVDLPPLDIPEGCEGLGPEAAAAQVRQHWRLGAGPIDNMVHLLEANGIEVYFLAEDSPAVDALCFWRDERAFVLLNRTKQDGGRARFDAAHELGHLVLHRARDFAAQPNDEAEHAADRFASAFLLPHSFVQEAPRVFDLSAFDKLRARWGVSVQAMVRRLYDVRIFTKWQYEDAYIKMSMLGYRSGSEPGCRHRETSFVHDAVIQYLGDARLGPRDLARAASISLDDLCTLMPAAGTAVEDDILTRKFFHGLRDAQPVLE